MGWCGYTIYSGDGTQSCHYNFIKWAKVKVSDNTVCDDEWLMYNKTKIPTEYLESFIDGIPLVIKRMPKIKKFWNEYDAIEWQMLLALCIDNKIKPPKIVYDNGITATEFLMTDHASDFDNPSLRRKNLKYFIKRAIKNGYEK